MYNALKGFFLYTSNLFHNFLPFLVYKYKRAFSFVYRKIAEEYVAPVVLDVEEEAEDEDDVYGRDEENDHDPAVHPAPAPRLRAPLHGPAIPPPAQHHWTSKTRLVLQDQEVWKVFLGLVQPDS